MSFQLFEFSGDLTPHLQIESLLPLHHDDVEYCTDTVFSCKDIQRMQL